MKNFVYKYIPDFKNLNRKKTPTWEVITACMKKFKTIRNSNLSKPPSDRLKMAIPINTCR